jgi:hypothetical protein
MVAWLFCFEEGGEMKNIKKMKRVNKCIYFLFIITVFSLLLPNVISAKPPTVIIIEPDPDSIVLGVVTLRAEATDNTGVTKVEFFVNGVLKGEGENYFSEGKKSFWSYRWDSTNVADGHCLIEALATDTSGKTDTHRISVIVNNAGINIPPVAVIDYSVDDNKYKFWPNSYDLDGYIRKYEYAILKNDGYDNYDLIDSYGCCDYCNPFDPENPDPLYDLCFDSYSCDAPSPSSGFCLFFSCPYICYEFLPPYDQGTYKVELTVYDNEGAPSLPVSDIIILEPSVPNDDMYIWRINPRIKRTGSGSTLIFNIIVFHDSDLDGQPEYEDSPVPGATVDMILKKDTDLQPDGYFDNEDPDFHNPIYSGTTNQDGEVIFRARGLSPGDYRAEVINLEGIFEWNRSMDVHNHPRDVTIW